MWIPMNRYPHKYVERQDLFMSTHRLMDLKEIKKELIVGEFFEWFCDMQMDNGVKYKTYEEKRLKNSIMIDKPLGMAVLAG